MRINNNQSSSSVRPKTVALGGNKIFFTQKCNTAGGGAEKSRFSLSVRHLRFTSSSVQQSINGTLTPLENVMKMIFRANHQFRWDYEKLYHQGNDTMQEINIAHRPSCSSRSGNIDNINSIR